MSPWESSSLTFVLTLPHVTDRAYKNTIGLSCNWRTQAKDSVSELAEREKEPRKIGQTLRTCICFPFVFLLASGGHFRPAGS